jgi:hypothetical protein
MDNSNVKKLPFFFIGKATTEERKQNFMNQKYHLLCDALGKEDTQSIWYTREHFAKLLEEIDHANGDGIMLHFGTYEKGHEFEGQLCLVMNITRTTNKESDFRRVNVFLEEEPDFNERSQKTRSLGFSNNLIKRDFNFGSPCPPRCHNLE